MKKISLFIFVAALAMSCEKKQNDTSEATSGTAKNQTKSSPDIPSDENQTAIQENQTNLSTEGKNVKIVQQAPVTTANNSGKKPALNPAHGEPFHRCDIAVGAPIDSAPAPQNPAPQIMPQNQTIQNFDTNPIPASPQPAAPVTQNTGPKPAVNPPHGEPHHRCDLQVGAPLI